MQKKKKKSIWNRGQQIEVKAHFWFTDETKAPLEWKKKTNMQHMRKSVCTTDNIQNKLEIIWPTKQTQVEDV